MITKTKESLDARVLKWAGLGIALFLAGSLVTIGGVATESRAVHASAPSSHGQMLGKPCPMDEHGSADHRRPPQCPST